MSKLCGKNIILDFDGTLIDTERVMLKSVMEYADNLGVPHDDGFMLQFVGASPSEIAEILTEKFGSGFDAIGFINGAVKYFNNTLITKPTPLRPGAKELLEYLKNNGFYMALATSTYAKIVEEEMRYHNLKGYFDIIVTGDMVEKCKPSPEIYLLTCNKMGVLPKDCYAVEDSTVGIVAAITAGMQTIVIPDLHEVRADLRPQCTAIVDSCFGLIDYFEGLCKKN